MGDQLLASLIAISLLLGIGGIAGGVYANFKSTALEASNKRLTTDNDYYLKKLTYQDTAIGKLETEVASVKRENQTLRTLVNPAAEIAALREQEAANHDATFGRLGEVKTALDLLHRDLQEGRP